MRESCRLSKNMEIQERSGELGKKRSVMIQKIVYVGVCVRLYQRKPKTLEP
jgi:hypothetical protein